VIHLPDPLLSLDREMRKEFQEKLPQFSGSLSVVIPLFLFPVVESR
jgi:hypothetical protein